MSRPIIFSLADTPNHPDFSTLYEKMGYTEIRLTSQRKAISALKKTPPDRVVGEFVNSFHTYYQATNISNLDVFLQSLVKYAPQAKVVIVVHKGDVELASQLMKIHPFITLLVIPFGEAALQDALAK